MVIVGLVGMVGCKKDEVNGTDNGNEWIDLGLPSGTKWSKANEEGFYTYDEAVLKFKFGRRLPSKTQWEELVEKCEWEWIDSETGGYRITGPNGKSITLPAPGLYYEEDGWVEEPGSYGCYWSSSVDYSDEYEDAYVWTLFFEREDHHCGVENCYREVPSSVRLVQD